MDNVFTTFLQLLNVKHTRSFSSKYFNEHPHKNNLFGLSKMLSDYGVKNAATRIEDKENDILNIQTPFIAYIGGDFANIYKVHNEKVNYIWNGKDIVLSIKVFCESWSGIVLLADPDKNSVEPNFQKNRTEELSKHIQKLLLCVAIFVLCAVAYASNSLFNNLGVTASLIVNLIGVYIGYLLVQKQIHLHSVYADKICSLFKQSDCNDILESKEAKLFGIIGWSEIGLVYFLSNIIILLLFPHLIMYFAIINIFALPYSLWSVWYQKVKAKQWCPLCLIIQALLWAIFIINLIFGFIQLPIFNVTDILIIGCIYLIPLLTINTLIPMLGDSEKMEQITQEINSIKANDEVFLTLLKTQPYYEVNKSTSNILLGNKDTNILVTIFTNPHCNPCAKMHARIEKLLESGNSNLCVQYIFSSFREELNSSNKFLIATHLNNNAEVTRKIYSEWFKQGKSSKEVFFEKYVQNRYDEATEQEFRKHENWKEQMGLRATPTILVNGYKLPDNYKIEDLKYIASIK